MVNHDDFNIPYDAEKIRGISTKLAEAEGVFLAEVLEEFNIALSKIQSIGYTKYSSVRIAQFCK